MSIDECPVTLNEFKEHLRRPLSDSLNGSLTIALLSAAEYIEQFCGREFSSFEKEQFPYQLRAAILLKAAAIFENPLDSVSERTTAAERLASPNIWRITK